MGDEDDLRNVSDELLRETQAIRRLELQKRTVRVSAPVFGRIAREIVLRAQRLLRLAAKEEAAAKRSPAPDASIDEMGGVRRGP